MDYVVHQYADPELIQLIHQELSNPKCSPEQWWNGLWMKAYHMSLVRERLFRERKEASEASKRNHEKGRSAFQKVGINSRSFKNNSAARNASRRILDRSRLRKRSRSLRDPVGTRWERLSVGESVGSEKNTDL